MIHQYCFSDGYVLQSTYGPLSPWLVAFVSSVHVSKRKQLLDKATYMYERFLSTLLVVALSHIAIISTNDSFDWSLSSVWLSKGWVSLCHKEGTNRRHTTHCGVWLSSFLVDPDVMLFSVLGEGSVISDIIGNLHPVKPSKIFCSLFSRRCFINLPFRS